MSVLSSGRGPRMAGHHSATSSGLDSAESLVSSLPSDASVLQTEITPFTSPTPSEGDSKMRTPRDILDASRRLGQATAPSVRSNLDPTPTRPPKQLHHHRNTQLIANDEAGYEADGDTDAGADVDRDVEEGTRASGARTPLVRPVRRPAFLRVDTRQHRRVASMLATRPGFTLGDVDTPRLRRITGKLGALPSIRLSKPTTIAAGTAGDNDGNAAEAECYELKRRPRAEPVGLGIGFPENHPLRSRAFSMPVPHSASPTFDPDEPQMEGRRERARENMAQGQGWEWDLDAARRSGWLPSHLPSANKTRSTQGGAYDPSLVRTAKLRPTPLDVSPSPIECLPGRCAVMMSMTNQTS